MRDGITRLSQVNGLGCDRSGMSLRRKEFDLPFPVSPPGNAGAGGFPPRRRHAARQPKTLASIMLPAPPTRGLQPPCESPVATWPQSNDFNTKETGCGAAHTLHFQDHFVLESESDFRIILGLENAVVSTVK